MSKLTRAVAVTGLAAGLMIGAAPMAMADSEHGPGDQANSSVKKSHKVSVSQNNKSVKAGEIETELKYVKNSNVTVEVEGAEQDQVNK